MEGCLGGVWGDGFGEEKGEEDVSFEIEILYEKRLENFPPNVKVSEVGLSEGRNGAGMDGLEDIVKVGSFLTNCIVGKGKNVEGPVVWGSELCGMEGGAMDCLVCGLGEHLGLVEDGLVEREATWDWRGVEGDGSDSSGGYCGCLS